MGCVKSVAREVLGLFVEDGSFAAAILAWAVIAGVGLPHMGLVRGVAASWTGPALFAGLALVLIESVVRFARRSK
jgi:hypothetical protein